MKRPAIISLVLILLCGAGYAGWHYLSGQSKGSATEAAATAVADAAVAVTSGWGQGDKLPYRVAVTHRVTPAGTGSGPWVIGVKTTLHVVGSDHRRDLCRLLPRVRDSVSLVLNGRLSSRDSAGDLQRYRGRLLQSVNKSLGANMVTALNLTATQEFSRAISGCDDVG